MDVFENEAQLFAHYLIARPANSQTVRLYESMANYKLDATDQKLLDYMRAHPWSIGLIDAGLVFYKPLSGARRRLYVMFAILEASPDYYDCFLPKRRGPSYILVIGYSGIRAVTKAVLGILLVRVIA